MKKIIISILFLLGLHIVLLSTLFARSMDYKYLGNNNAPVVIYNFSSLSCPHCATFTQKILPKLVDDYISKGKVKIIFIDVPFGGPNVLLAHTVLHYTKSNEEFFQLTHAFLANQAVWAVASNPIPELQKYTTLLGMSPSVFKKAAEDKELQQWLLNQAKIQLKTLGIQGTPTFFFSKQGEKLTSTNKHISGVPPYEDFKDIIENMLK